MREVRDIQDLRPAPRRAPVALLWTMFLVMLCGTGVLVWQGTSAPTTQVAAEAGPASAATVPR